MGPLARRVALGSAPARPLPLPDAEALPLEALGPSFLAWLTGALVRTSGRRRLECAGVGERLSAVSASCAACHACRGLSICSVG